MDLGLVGFRAIVCASSAGLGRACAMALADAGVHLTLNGRDADRLARTAREIQEASGVEVATVVADVSTEEGRAALLAATPAPDILINNNGGPPPADYSTLGLAELQAGIDANMIAPIRLMQAVAGGMAERGFGRIVNVTSSSVKAPLPDLDLSSGARAGLTGFAAGVARQLAPFGVTINNLLPGVFDTDRIRALSAAASRRTGLDEAEIRRRREKTIPVGRLGDPAEFGAACAFLCSRHAGYITGQSLLMDGGSFAGIM